MASLALIAVRAVEEVELIQVGRIPDLDNPSVSVYTNHMKEYSRTDPSRPYHIKSNPFIVCLYCGRTIARRHWRQKFCSHKCYGAYKKANKIGPPPRPIVERTPQICPNCEKTWFVLPWQITQGARFCCRQCYREFRRKQSLQTPNHLFYVSYAWQSLRRRIKTRDGYTCQQCRTIFDHTSRSLTVHHIKPRLLFEGTTSKIHPEADAPNNLLSLCSSCHQSVHVGRITLYISEFQRENQ